MNQPTTTTELRQSKAGFVIELLQLVLFAAALVVITILVVINVRKDTPNTDFTCTQNSAGIACTSEP